MKKNKTMKRICDEFFEFKITFGHVYYLMKLFYFLYYELEEMGTYPENKKYVAKCCLYSLTEVINKILNRTNEQISILFEDFTNIQEGNYNA